MNKTESLNLVESAIADTEEQLKILLYHEKNGAKNREIIAELETGVAELQNQSHADVKQRASRYVAANSYLTLSSCDQESIQTKIDSQSNCVVQSWQRATGLLQQVWSAVLAARKSNVEASLEANFDLRQLRTLPSELSSVALSVIEVADMQNTLLCYRRRSERDAAIQDARLLRERSELLLSIATDELAEGFSLVIAVAESAEPEPATMSAALVAA